MERMKRHIYVFISFIEILVVSLFLVQRDCFQDETFYNVDNIGEIMRMVFDET